MPLVETVSNFISCINDLRRFVLTQEQKINNFTASLSQQTLDVQKDIE